MLIDTLPDDLVTDHAARAAAYIHPFRGDHALAEALLDVALCCILVVFATGLSSAQDCSCRTPCSDQRCLASLRRPRPPSELPMPSITSTSVAWGVIFASGVLEVVFSVAMKLSDGYTRFLPALVSIAAGIVSVWLMSLTLKVLPVGTAYAVWAGIGAAGTAAAGIVAFQEPANAARLLCIALVVAGIVGLQLQTAR